MPIQVREFHHTLLWPIQLRPLKREGHSKAIHFWDILKRNPGAWREVHDGLLIDDESCQVGYEEFVYFLPYVQRFLYGVGEEGHGAQSSLRIFQRDDIRQARVHIKPGTAPLLLDISRMRLHFFYDLDTALLTFQVSSRDLSLEQAGEILDRFGRPYPPAWEDFSGQAAHCCERVAFLDENGNELTVSDYGDREKYIKLVRNARQTPLSAHWEYLMQPLVPAYKQGGTIKFYQIENKRIPIMTYLSFDEPRDLGRGDIIRLAFAARPGAPDSLPYSSGFLRDFESTYCYDRYWEQHNAASGMNTRYIFCGVAFTMLAKYQDERGDLLRHFQHQFYQIGLIAHFHKAALLNLSNRFSRAVERLNVRDPDSVKTFKRDVRETLEVFLRFNHRYWFHELSNQVQASDFFRCWSHQLGTDALYAEVREEAHDINQYLDNDRTRKQADNAMRLTVVSACGMVGTIVTGFLGMNLYSHVELPSWTKLLIFLAVFIPTILLALYTVAISKRLATFMEALSSETLTWQEKMTAFRQIWGADKRDLVRNRRYGPGMSDHRSP